jgi:hypothetical protein
MQAVTAALMEKHHYRVNSSGCLTVFDYAYWVLVIAAFID